MSDGDKKLQGFACLSPEARKEMAGKGGKKVWAMNKAHRFTSDAARAAGRLGGLKVSEDKAYMAALGRKGGQAKRGGKK